ncbi:uncharacterized protein LOC134649149 [Cydia amplana]|uniref:uncharacterized protein LOC134649149 n=1 Tax=Cydia amplana TaxID=1869771 RepID=UPI002FE52DDC
MSEDVIAPSGSDTLAALQSKHPSPSRPLCFPAEPGLDCPTLSMKVEDVVLAINSFHNGSAAGLDGIRPAHLKELISGSAGDGGVRLLEALTKLCNFLLGGKLNPLVCPYLYGATLCALKKKEGGVRPIAVGCTLRRLVAKLGCRAVRGEMASYLQPHQVGFGTRLGCEAAIHAVRAFALDPANSGCVIVKLDVKNAFNSLERDVLLNEVGAQQGDPLGPLTFSLAIHKVITELKSPLNVWYLDDGTIGGKPDEVEQDLLILLPRLRDLGLEVNTSKFPEALRVGRDLLQLAGERLKEISPHIALVLMQKCFAVPKMTYLLRTSPVWQFPDEITSFDDTIKATIEAVVNVSLSDDQWRQAALPVRHGGIGVRRVQDVSLPAFLASAHGVADLVADILSLNGDKASIPFVADALREWLALNPGAHVPENPKFQRAWDDVGCKDTLNGLIGNAVGTERARLLAVSQSESGAWLHALPSPQLGTLLDSDSLRVSVALRLGCKVCEPHICICGTMVGADGHHALSCRRCAGRHPRHHALNDIVQRALRSAGIPSVLEPPGLSRTDGKRPDGLTLVPWERGRCLVWDATCVSTFAASHISRTVRAAGAAAESQAGVKRQKYAPLGAGYIFLPFAVETAGCWGADAKDMVRDIGRRLRQKGEDPRSESFLRWFKSRDDHERALGTQRREECNVGMTPAGTGGPGAIH